MIQERNIAVQVILSIITCGIYGIYWFITLTNDAAKMAEEPDFKGGMAFLFTILTCGIYGIYWYYKMGKVVYTAGEKNGEKFDDNAVLYLVLGILGFGIINYCIMQNDLNKLARKETTL